MDDAVEVAVQGDRGAGLGDIACYDVGGQDGVAAVSVAGVAEKFAYKDPRVVGVLLSRTKSAVRRRSK